MCLLLGNIALQVENAYIYLSCNGGVENCRSKEWQEEKGGGVKGQVQSL